MRYVEFKGERLPMVGIGTWCIGDDPSKRESELASMQEAIDSYGMTMIDTAEMYGLGLSEAVVGELIARNDRSRLFVVDKILPENACAGCFENSVRRSLELTGCEYFDLYLLHWRARTDLEVVVREMEALVQKGLIRHWGVSNFDVADMEELFSIPGGSNCFANQYLYNISTRGVEYDLLKWCEEHDVLSMIYSPMGDTREAQLKLYENPLIKQACELENCSITALMLRFVIRSGKLTALAKTSKAEHLHENMAGIDEPLRPETLELIDRAFPSPKCKQFLEKI